MAVNRKEMDMTTIIILGVVLAGVASKAAGVGSAANRGCRLQVGAMRTGDPVAAADAPVPARPLEA